MADISKTEVVEQELNLDKKVVVRSIAGWTVGFARLDGFGDISIAPEGRTSLSRNEIIAQVQSGNKLFAGIDGMGSHATIYIEDAPTRREVDFESTDGKTKQVFFSDNAIKKIFDIKSQDAFEEAFKKTIVTRAEKYAASKAIKRLGISDYSKIVFAVDYTGYKI